MLDEIKIKILKRCPACRRRGEALHYLAKAKGLVEEAEYDMIQGIIHSLGASTGCGGFSPKCPICNGTGSIDDSISIRELRAILEGEND